ncbi:hypothetical protein [Sphingobium lactosutens]|uniref:Uncharacterized protein n=1 Tax=Sphingobium lactosutens DS20 TaxID=1331060 RepID=T0IVZ1_9SPHN|nr:hypothetical protein [Sphingobium lactosutens]EQB13844.1 hypothetical protein RLDS_15050 [Sphingobium lactosutens DS20]
MLTLVISLLVAGDQPEPFPERFPTLMEACLNTAVAAGDVTETEASHKYICGGDSAAQMWDFLQDAHITSYEQDTPQGRWLSRDFPLGGCFKRILNPDGERATNGLSCSIWIPRAIGKEATSP